MNKSAMLGAAFTGTVPMAKTLQQLEAELEQLQAKVNEERRRTDTRRKILLGIAVQAAVEDGQISADQIHQLLDRYITRKSDRRFLGLPHKADTQEGKGAKDLTAQ